MQTDVQQKRHTHKLRSVASCAPFCWALRVFLFCPIVGGAISMRYFKLIGIDGC